MTSAAPWFFTTSYPDGEKKLKTIFKEGFLFFRASITGLPCSYSPSEEACIQTISEPAYRLQASACCWNFAVQLTRPFSHCLALMLNGEISQAAVSYSKMNKS